MSEVKMQECGNKGCGMIVPIGYLSMREYCASCENRDYIKLLARSDSLQNRLDSIRELAWPALTER